MQSRLHCAGVEALESRKLLASIGVPDTSFSGDGKTTVDFGLKQSIPYSIEAIDVAVQSDGKTVVAGSFISKTNSGQVDFAVVRFNLDGSLDQSFGKSPDHKGIVLQHIGKKDSRDFASAMAIQSDGKILVAGTARRSRFLAVDTDDFAVMRLNPDGSLDKSFDGDGIAIIQFHDASSVEAIAFQPNGKIILAGEDDVGGGGVIIIGDIDFDFAVTRLNANGSLDKTFNNGGKKTIDFGGNDFCQDVVVDNGGNIVLVGSTDQRPGSFAMARVKSTGELDSTFGFKGKQITAFTGRPGASALGALAQPDGKIVVVGRTGGTIGGITARFSNDGKVDPSFGPSGAGFVETAGMTRASDVIRSSDGGLIVGGGTKDGKFQIVGYTANGLLRSDFGKSGIIVTDFGDKNALVFGLAKGPGRRFVAAGGRLVHTARYLDSGANVVSVGAIDPDATEGASDNGALIVGRTERLSVPTRVFLNISGTASQTFFGAGLLKNDYSVTGLRLPGFNSTDFRAFVDIPAGQTFVVLPLVPRDDTTIEGSETAIFSISPDPSYEIGTPSSGQIDIADNDQGVTTNLNGINDAYVRDGTSAGTNFGSEAELQVKTGAAGANRFTYIKFDLTSVGSISSAKLNLFGRLSDTQSSNVQVSLFPVADQSWTGSSITFNNKPAPGASALASVTVTDNTQRLYSFDVSNYVKQEKALGHNLVSFMLKAPSASTSFVTFVSGNAGGSNQPKLSVISSSDSVGTFTVSAPPSKVKVGEPAKIAVTWIVPSGGWRQLTWIKLSIRDLDDDDSIGVLKFEEADNSFRVVNQPGNGPSPISLLKSSSSFKAAGPTASKVTVTFAFRFNSVAAGHRFALEVSAQNDIGSRSAYSPSGSVRVAG